MTKFSVLAMLSGSALATLSACSEPAPRVGVATARLEIGQAQNSVESCGLTVPVQTLPPDNAINLLDANTTAEFIAELPEVTDGENGDSVRCKVVESDGIVEFEVSIEKGPAELTMRGATNGNPGYLGFRKSPELLNQHSTDSCLYTVDSDPTSEWAGSGTTKISFTCTGFSTPGNPESSCGVDGTFVVRNCDQ